MLIMDEVEEREMTENTLSNFYCCIKGKHQSVIEKGQSWQLHYYSFRYVFDLLLPGLCRCGLGADYARVHCWSGPLRLGGGVQLASLTFQSHIWSSRQSSSRYCKHLLRGIWVVGAILLHWCWSNVPSNWPNTAINQGVRGWVGSFNALRWSWEPAGMNNVGSWNEKLKQKQRAQPEAVSSVTIRDIDFCLHSSAAFSLPFSRKQNRSSLLLNKWPQKTSATLSDLHMVGLRNFSVGDQYPIMLNLKDESMSIYQRCWFLIACSTISFVFQRY